MRNLRDGDQRSVAIGAIEVVVALAVATGLVAVLELGLDLANASSIYLLAVAATAILGGTGAAIATAVGAFLAYNLLFVEPRVTFAVARAEEWVTLLLLLFIGVVIGRLTGSQRDREREAVRREREARALFGVTRELSTTHRLTDALREILPRLIESTGMARTWIGLGPTPAQERTISDTASGQPPPIGAHSVLQRDREEGAATWTRIRPSGPVQSRRGERPLYRVELRVGAEAVGSLWSERDPSAGEPYLEQTRMLAVAADLIAQAVQRDRLATAAAETEISRRSDELRSALLDSVSHDLRTPLATIRAAAGSLADPTIQLADDERRATAAAIDREAERLNRLVGTLLDMSRIQSGALMPDLEVVPLAELVEPVLDRMRTRLGTRSVSLNLPDLLAAVRVDATFFVQALDNLIENAITHASPEARIEITARSHNGVVELVIEDGGPGVPPQDLPHLFERFYRGETPGPGSRRGFGLGLAVVQGLVVAMGGSVEASTSRLGGLAVTMRLPAATPRVGEA